MSELGGRTIRDNSSAEVKRGAVVQLRFWIRFMGTPDTGYSAVSRIAKGNSGGRPSSCCHVVRGFLSAVPATVRVWQTSRPYPPPAAGAHAAPLTLQEGHWGLAIWRQAVDLVMPGHE